MTTTSLFTPSRRRVLQGMGAGLVTAALPGHVWGQAAPLKVGFQLHRTGIGAAYGRWYERTATAAATAINAAGGIAGVPSNWCLKMTQPTPSAARRWWKSWPVPAAST